MSLKAVHEIPVNLSIDARAACAAAHCTTNHGVVRMNARSGPGSRIAATSNSTVLARPAGWAAVLALSLASIAAHAQNVTLDTTTYGNWQGKYGTCGYVLPSQKVFPTVETPIPEAVKPVVA